MMINLKKFKVEFIRELSSIYNKEEATALFSWLTEDLLHLKTHDFLLQTEVDIHTKQLHIFQQAKSRLLKQEPIQYILGYTEFFGLKINVTPDVLIPRPETEELVQWVLEDCKAQVHQLSLIDIGTGSGCIPIALAKNLPQAKVMGLDISEYALQLAASNSELHDAKVEFIKSDVLQLKSLPEVDVIVSNPPYVKYDEHLKMKDNVLKHEPHLALFVANDDPLIFYKKIAELALKAKKKPVVYVEISQYLAQDTSQLFKDFGFEQVEIKKDFRGNDRMLKAY